MNNAVLKQRFTWFIVLRVVLLTTAISTLTWIWADPGLFFTRIILFLAILGLVIELIRFVNTSNREVARFLFSVRHGDLSATFKHRPLGSSFMLLQEEMTELAESYKNVKIEKEAQYHLLQTLVDRIAVGIVVVAGDQVTLINASAQKLMDVGTSQNWKLISQHNAFFVREIIALGEHGRKLIEVPFRGASRMISTDVTTMHIMGTPSRLITLQDINAEIEQKEIEAWHKLIRILTHEIMNSITPISSLTETMQGMLTNADGTRRTPSAVTNETIADLLFSLNTIHVRSEGLLNFVENYRKLTRVPRPNPVPVDLGEFVAGVRRLMEEATHRQGATLNVIDMRTETRPSFDPALIQQVLINLISNAIHATEGMTARSITMTTSLRDDHVLFDIDDTGKGIPQNLLREIFVPFFSTRHEGSGIGLSLSKQIVSSHGGTISVRSSPGSGTTFSVSIPATPKKS